MPDRDDEGAGIGDAPPEAERAGDGIMPSRSKRPCKGIGCPALVDSGYCDKCQPKAHKADRDARGSAQERGYDWQWKQARDMFLRGNPLCAQCEQKGIMRAAVLVDHIIPLAMGGDRLSESNLQSLCADHHAAKTARETRG